MVCLGQIQNTFGACADDHGAAFLLGLQNLAQESGFVVGRLPQRVLAVASIDHEARASLAGGCGSGRRDCGRSARNE